MKNTLKNIIILTMGLFLLSSCNEDNRKYFNLKNNSNKPIYHAFSFSSPDTTLANISNIPNRGNKISPRRTSPITLGLFSYNTTMQIFIFDSDVIESTPWDTIVKYNMILKRYQFTESELGNRNWKISYDGN